MRVVTAEPHINRLSILVDNKPALVFHSDGTVWADPELKPDEAARAIIDSIIELFPTYHRDTSHL